MVELYAKILVQYGILNMEVHLSPEVQAELKRAASERGCSVDQFVQEIVEAYLDHDRWFRAEVQKGLAQLDDGERVSHDEVVESIKRMFQL